MADDGVDPITQHSLGTISDRLAKLESSHSYQRARVEAAEVERNRQGKELSEFRRETRERFAKLESMLEPITVMSKAQKMIFGWGIAAIGAAGTLVLIWDYFLKWARGS